MLNVTPIKLNRPSQISFKDNSLNNMTPNVAVLSLQNPNALINFQRDFSLSKSADAVQSNPLKALGYKFVRMFKFLSQPSNTSNYLNYENSNLYELI